MTELVRVLCVEEDEADTAPIGGLLRQIRGTRYALDRVAGFASGLGAVLEDRHDVVLVEQQLGQHTGLELIRRAVGQGCRAPLILLVGSNDEEVDEAALRAGASDLLNIQGLIATRLQRAIRYAAAQRRSELQRIELVREQLARQQAEAVARTKDAFLAAVSHELRTPLNAILGWAQVLDEGGIDTPLAPKAVGAILRNARLQAQLVDDLLDAARIAQGSLRMDREPVFVEDVIDGALDAVRPDARRKGVDLHVVIEPGLPPMLGDVTRLQQVVWNLVGNAIKFTPRNSRVDVGIARRGDVVDIAVHDQGPGIPPELLPRIFDRFRTADGAPTTRGAGLGLGLAIVKTIVDLHGGSVSVDGGGDQSGGATFRVTLPLGSGDVPTPVRRRTPTGKVGLDALVGRRLLLLEPDEDMREYLAGTLGLHGAEVAETDDPNHAFERLKDSRFDAFLCACDPSEPSGFALMRQIRASADPEVRDLPAASLSPAPAPAERDRSLQAGFQLHMSKPLAPRELVSLVAALLGVGDAKTST